ncbi:MAG: S46 family peptidase [Bacteroidia bacterium]|nr:S46 family peptidase [Bacteroidia bacterium]
MNYKKLLVVVFCIFITPAFLLAEEGMWIPSLVKKINIDRMQELGFKLSAEDIYSVNKSSLKDGIVHFGGGCTAEVISGEGLILTNHHCGYSNIQRHSSVENDYLTDGVWAENKKAELPCKGLTATFIVRIEDVTEKVNSSLTANMTEPERKAAIDKVSASITAEATKDSHYKGQVKAYYYGNEFYLIVTETYRDVRLVGAPPSSIGKFGGDTDNWVWPRHTGDFSLFRIYANADNEPADYSKDNVPYKSKFSFPISIKGMQEGDFTMVYGFPGRTSEYLTSHGVDQIYSVTNPHAIAIRDERLKVMDAAMLESAKIRIQYASKQSRVSNAWKKWQGQNTGLARYDAINLKQQREADFTKWVNEDATRKKDYGSLLETFGDLYEKLEPHRLHRLYVNEGMYGIEAIRYANGFRKLHEMSVENPVNAEEVTKEIEKRKKAVAGYFKNYHQPIDKKIFRALIELSMEKMPQDLQPAIFEKINKKYSGNLDKYTEHVFNTSVFVDESRMNDFLDNYKTKKVYKLEQDPIYQLMASVLNHYHETSSTAYSETNGEIVKLYRTYMKALQEMSGEKKLYPDANSTLRVAFGKVEGYKARNAVQYEAFTTLEGIAEKYDPEHRDFKAPKRLIELYKAKDYGPYGVNGTLPVAFVSSNHTSGGNSGSPVINANGELIGLNFDRNWIGTMSDIVYDPSVCRNISVDIRYVLFIVDKFAGATHLIDEMKIVKD